MNTQGSDQVFPSDMPNGDHYAGLSKRELFAALCMQGMCGNQYYDGESEQMAMDAVRHADALISALNKEAKP